MKQIKIGIRYWIQLIDLKEYIKYDITPYNGSNEIHDYAIINIPDHWGTAEIRTLLFIENEKIYYYDLNGKIHFAGNIEKGK